MSHSATSHNVVLKVTVPKRTGRKRKRGTDGPWEGEVEMTHAPRSRSPREQICSKSRLDNPKVLRRKMQDNVDNYDVEAVGVIKHTHRFRGMADFHWSLKESPFISRFMDQVMPGDSESACGLRCWKHTDSYTSHSNEELPVRRRRRQRTKRGYHPSTSVDANDAPIHLQLLTESLRTI